jgi:hypothetical protein
MNKIQRTAKNDQPILEILAEELKQRMYSNGLIKAGLDDPSRKSNLGAVILAYVGLDFESADALALYDVLLDKYSVGLKVYTNSVAEAASKLFLELQMQKQVKTGEKAN